MCQEQKVVVNAFVVLAKRCKVFYAVRGPVILHNMMRVRYQNVLSNQDQFDQGGKSASVLQGNDILYARRNPTEAAKTLRDVLADYSNNESAVSLWLIVLDDKIQTFLFIKCI